MRDADHGDVKAWCAASAQRWEQFCEKMDPALWLETATYASEFRGIARNRLASAEITLGGGGHYPLLYFLVRHYQPKIVVETGVAAGFSSRTILKALETNGDNGKLFSSDLPYFRLANSEKYIGWLVDDELKRNWRLYKEGDRNNLPDIVSQITEIDLFHYDSDKSYVGRQSTMRLVLPRLRVGSIIVMDDIQDNWFFRDFIQTIRAPYAVFGFNRKYVGFMRLEVKPYWP
jgi:predicted O-methyltransferase YrrM